jgi:hypothetical protein
MGWERSALVPTLRSRLSASVSLLFVLLRCSSCLFFVRRVSLWHLKTFSTPRPPLKFHSVSATATAGGSGCCWGGARVAFQWCRNDVTAALLS